nr:nucleoid-associated protein [Tessaracoccus sp. OS52]
MVAFALKGPRQIVEDDRISSSTPQLVRDAMTDPDKRFVDTSQGIAQNLFAAQTGNSPAGILIVAIVKEGASQSLLIMKAEHQAGIRLQKRDGVFGLQLLDDLVVGQNTRVYKVAVLTGGADGTLIGQMVDQQNGDAYAAFFLSAFLGCRLADDAEVQTKAFMDGALDFFSSGITDEAKRMKYVQAVTAYIQSPADTFQATEFAQQFLEPEDRDAFIDDLPEDLRKNVVSKNLSLVPGRGGGLRLYAHGVIVSANSLALERGDLKIVAQEDDSVTIQIRGRVTRYQYGSAPKMDD